MITHSYPSTGDYNVILTVTDDDEAMSSTSKTITINPLAATSALATRSPQQT
ncbi:MAG: hypothetical protein EF812_03700 [Methanosarcinales archaeon]|nr:MAG: hypothetical protein EF812_03700 [Methanosarcinales archaeon]